jgi:hydroxymethylpyrimidine/phosphomethylpyrimidine kinase
MSGAAPDTARTAIALTVAGSDSSGGAGIQADLKTFSAFGVYGASVVTALTAQNTRGVQGIHAVPAGFVAAQLQSVLSDLDVAAIKTGMLADARIVEAVARTLRSAPSMPLIVDPVMVATSGDVLLAPEAVAALKRDLIPLATLITPNLAEAAILLGSTKAESESEMLDQARALLALGSRAVLLKGGHARGDAAVDLLADATAPNAWRWRAWTPPTPTAPDAPSLRPSLPCWRAAQRSRRPSAVPRPTSGTACSMAARSASAMGGGRLTICSPSAARRPPRELSTRTHRLRNGTLATGSRSS